MNGILLVSPNGHNTYQSNDVTIYKLDPTASIVLKIVCIPCLFPHTPDVMLSMLQDASTQSEIIRSVDLPLSPPAIESSKSHSFTAKSGDNTSSANDNPNAEQHAVNPDSFLNPVSIKYIAY